MKENKSFFEFKKFSDISRKKIKSRDKRVLFLSKLLILFFSSFNEIKVIKTLNSNILVLILITILEKLLPIIVLLLTTI
jgi:hypothetical protein